MTSFASDRISQRLFEDLFNHKNGAEEKELSKVVQLAEKNKGMGFRKKIDMYATGFIKEKSPDGVNKLHTPMTRAEIMWHYETGRADGNQHILKRSIVQRCREKEQRYGKLPVQRSTDFGMNKTTKSSMKKKDLFNFINQELEQSRLSMINSHSHSTDGYGYRIDKKHIEELLELKKDLHNYKENGNPFWQTGIKLDKDYKFNSSSR